MCVHRNNCLATSRKLFETQPVPEILSGEGKRNRTKCSPLKAVEGNNK